MAEYTNDSAETVRELVALFEARVSGRHGIGQQCPGGRAQSIAGGTELGLFGRYYQVDRIVSGLDTGSAAKVGLNKIIEDDSD